MFSKLQQTYVGHWPVFHFEEQKEKKNTFLTLLFLWENNNRQYVYLRWSYTAQRKSSHTRGVSWLLRRVQPIFPNPCQDLWFRCILFFLSFMKGWSNQAWKCVSSVCWRVRRDFQNNPLSRWGFFMDCFVIVRCSVFQDSRGHDNYAKILSSWMAGPFSGTVLNTVSLVHTSDLAVLLFSLLTGHILSNEMLNCFILGTQAEVIHVSRIKLLYSILQPRWDCGCSSIFNKCLFPRGPCWALWVNSVQEGKACSPHSRAL